MLICISNRKLCKDDFLNQIDKLTKGQPHAVMLREKDLNPEEYEALAKAVKTICDSHHVDLIINQNIETAALLKVERVQLSMENLRKLGDQILAFKAVGASVHSVEQAEEAQRLGASYLIAGHVFPTDCKKGMPARGLRFLKAVCDAVTIPVFAIGGISEGNYKMALIAGAKGVCVMSEAMTCDQPETLASRFRGKLKH
jgi:thiamine-phosphate pyrophosphorylase